MRAVILIAAMGCAFVSASARAEPPTDERIERLLEVTDARNMIDQMREQMREAVTRGMQQGLAGKPMTDAQKQVFALQSQKLGSLLTRMLTWDAYKPFLVRTYREVYTAEEVEAQITFYDSPVGRSIRQKMPDVMRSGMAWGQEQSRHMQPELERFMRESVRDMIEAGQPAPRH